MDDRKVLLTLTDFICLAFLQCTAVCLTKCLLKEMVEPSFRYWDGWPPLDATKTVSDQKELDG